MFINNQSINIHIQKKISKILLLLGLLWSLSLGKIVFLFDWTNRWTKKTTNETAKALNLTSAPPICTRVYSYYKHNTIDSVPRLFALWLYLVMLQQSLEWKHNHHWFRIKMNVICVNIYKSEKLIFPLLFINLQSYNWILH